MTELDWEMADAVQKRFEARQKAKANELQMDFALIANRNAERIATSKKAEVKRKERNAQEIHDLIVGYLALGLFFLIIFAAGWVEANL